VIIARHTFIYLLIRISGTGLRSLKGTPKYILKEIISPIQSYINSKYSIPIKFSKFKFDNDSFSDNIWGDGIISKLGFDEENKTYLRVSSSDFNKLMKEYPSIQVFFKNNEIKSITAKNIKLEINTPDEKFPGKVKFTQDGHFTCNFADLEHFNSFVEKLIDSKKFFKQSVSL
jgi:hypothetical protein